MSVEISGVSCRNCGGTLPSARPGRFAHGRQPCPACGPGNRFVKVVIEFHSDLTLKKKMTRGFRSGGVGRAPPRSIGRAMSWAPTAPDVIANGLLIGSTTITSRG